MSELVGTELLDALVLAAQIGADETSKQGDRLGLKWRLRRAVVDSTDPVVMDTSEVPVKFSGDDVAVRAVSLIGFVPNGLSVMVLVVPPAGNYIIGTLGAPVGQMRIETVVQTVDSAVFLGVEETVMTVTARLLAGNIYRVYFYGKANSSVGTDEILFRIREDDDVGAEKTSDRVDVNGSTTAGRKSILEVEYEPPADEDKTFVVTGVRSSGTGNGFLEAATTRPSYFYIDWIRRA